MNNAIKKKQSTNKKRVAPLSYKSAKDEEKKETPLQADEYDELTDEMLDQLFLDAPTSEIKNVTSSESKNEICPTLQSKTAGQLIDLDDWYSKGEQSSHSLPSCTKNSQSSASKLPRQMQIASATGIKSPSLNRKELMFSSIEFENDSTLNLRFLKRLVPATKLKEISSSLKQVSLYNSCKYSESKDWYTFGVVAEYSKHKKAGSGRIDVTDLAAEPYTMRFLLFGTAFDESNPIPVGSIICILRPSKTKPFNGREALAANSADQILIAGTSRDFGLCGSKKKAGGYCRAIVNLNICRFCRYHAMAEFKERQVAKDLKSAAAGVGLGVKTPNSPGLWNAAANKAQFLNPAKKNVAQIKKDTELLNKLNGSGARASSSSQGSSSCKSTQLTPPHTSPTSCLQKFDNAKLQASVEAKVQAEKRKREYSSENILPKGTPLNVANERSSSSVESRLSPSSRGMSAAKRQALQFVREKGPLVSEKKKPKIKIDEETTEEKEKGFTEEFFALMNEKPRDATLLSDAEAAQRDKHFERLQVMEEVSEKLVATHEVSVRAIRCLVCKKSYHQMPLQCVMNKHSCRPVMATKRFFECNGCRARTTTLGRMPSSECAKCGVWSWKRAGMAAERVCSVAPQLAVRGLEEKYVNSIVKDPNLNLLVPDNV